MFSSPLKTSTTQLSQSETKDSSPTVTSYIGKELLMWTPTLLAKAIGNPLLDSALNGAYSLSMLATGAHSIVESQKEHSVKPTAQETAFKTLMVAQGALTLYTLALGHNDYADLALQVGSAVFATKAVADGANHIYQSGLATALYQAPKRAMQFAAYKITGKDYDNKPQTPVDYVKAVAGTLSAVLGSYRLYQQLPKFEKEQIRPNIEFSPEITDACSISEQPTCPVDTDLVELFQEAEDVNEGQALLLQYIKEHLRPPTENNCKRIIDVLPKVTEEMIDSYEKERIVIGVHCIKDQKHYFTISRADTWPTKKLLGETPNLETCSEALKLLPKPSDIQKDSDVFFNSWSQAQQQQLAISCHTNIIGEQAYKNANGSVDVVQKIGPSLGENPTNEQCQIATKFLDRVAPEIKYGYLPLFKACSETDSSEEIWQRFKALNNEDPSMTEFLVNQDNVWAAYTKGHLPLQEDISKIFLKSYLEKPTLEKCEKAAELITPFHQIENENSLSRLVGLESLCQNQLPENHAISKQIANTISKLKSSQVENCKSYHPNPDSCENIADIMVKSKQDDAISDFNKPW